MKYIKHFHIRPVHNRRPHSLRNVKTNPKKEFQFPDLMISTGISQNKETRFTKSSLKLIGECSWSVATCNSLCTCILSKLQHCPLTIWPCRLNYNVLGILDGHNNTRCKLKFLPCLSYIDNEDTCKKTRNHTLRTTNYIVQRDQTPKIILMHKLY